MTASNLVPTGLPPQVRGEQGRGVGRAVAGGLTPAGAGRTCASRPEPPCSTAYPRRCGENAGKGVDGYAAKGLPPQVRGERARAGRDVPAPGLTPAGAGRTKRCSARPRRCTAYPRRCGENQDSAAFSSPAEGLPPQVRGEPPQQPARRCGLGLTPAGAGRTGAAGLGLRLSGAYPRRCGENRRVPAMTCQAPGLPPQVRGEPSTCGIGFRLWGLTPAGAGRTRHGTSDPPAKWAYPRRCGENLFAGILAATFSGLPPQVRGERSCPCSDTSSIGLTPAGAGRTAPRSPMGAQARAYPRRCGENKPSATIHSGVNGLPPQVRGEHLRVDPHAAPDGLTPAGAGRTNEPSARVSVLAAYPRRCGENMTWPS